MTGVKKLDFCLFILNCTITVYLEVLFKFKKRLYHKDKRHEVLLKKLQQAKPLGSHSQVNEYHLVHESQGQPDNRAAQINFQVQYNAY